MMSQTKKWFGSGMMYSSGIGTAALCCPRYWSWIQVPWRMASEILRRTWISRIPHRTQGSERDVDRLHLRSIRNKPEKILPVPIKIFPILIDSWYAYRRYVTTFRIYQIHFQRYEILDVFAKYLWITLTLSLRSQQRNTTSPIGSKMSFKLSSRFELENEKDINFSSSTENRIWFGEFKYYFSASCLPTDIVFVTSPFH